MATNITIARLNTLVTANAVQFTQEFNRAENVATRTASSINQALGKIGLGVSAAGLIAFGKSVIDFGSQITDLAQVAGMGNQAFQTLSAKAAESGVTMEMVSKGAENLRSKLQDAADGSQTIRDELSKLGLTFQGLQSLAPEKQWEAIAQQVEGAKDKQQAYNIVSDLFGAKIGPKLKEVLAALGGKDGFAGLNDQMAKLRISDAQLKSLDDAGDALTNLWTKMKVFGAKGVVGAINVVQDDIAGISGLKGGNGKTLGDSAKAIWDRLGLGDGSSALGDFNKGGSMAGANGTTLHFGLEKTAKSLGEEMARGARAWEEAHPWDSITQENAQTSKVKSMLDAFFSPIDATEKASRDQRIKVDFPGGDTDRLTRIGLLTGGTKSLADEGKKQTDLLKNVVQELKNLNAKGAEVATYA